MREILNPIEIAAPAGPYSQAIRVSGAGSWLHIAGQVGLAPDGTLANGFEAQARVAWENLVALLHAAGMTVDNLVKVTTFVTDPEELALLGPVRAEFLGTARPASTLIVARALAKPDWKFEVDAVAFKDE